MYLESMNNDEALTYKYTHISISKVYVVYLLNMTFNKQNLLK